MKIDLSTCPSMMETRAASWAKANMPAPEPEKPRVKPQVYAKPTPPEPKPEKVRKRPTGSDIDLKPTPCAEFDAEQRRLAYKDALRAFATDLPDPAHYAQQMPVWAQEALANASFEKQTTTWLLHPAYHDRIPELRALGLIPVGGRPVITGFSLDVRRALLVLMKEMT